jgi:predicted amidohydrolase
MYRIALANLPFPNSNHDSLERVIAAIHEAARNQAKIVCFPEAYLPGYRAWNDPVAQPDAQWLENAWANVAEATKEAEITTVLATERIVDGDLRISVLVFDPDGSLQGIQDKTQLDPSEDVIYRPGFGRRVFTTGVLTFGVVICHEGFRYPETSRAAACAGAQLIFHPHYHKADGDSYRPTTFGESNNTFHEKALMCRAAENTCFVATVNYASEGSPSTTAVLNPDGSVHSFQLYGVEGILYADLDLSKATLLLANRFKPEASAQCA